MTSLVRLAFALGLVSLVAGTEFASQLRKCSVDNQNALNTCLKQIMEDLRPRTKTGIPELGLPVLEPMHINNIVFQQGDAAVNVQAQFMQVKVQGLSNYTTSFVNADPRALTLSVGLKVPELRVTGHYELKGQVIIFPVTGSGTFWTNLNNIDASGVGKLSVQQGPDGQDRLRVSDTKINFDIRSISLHLSNLFNGDRVLGDTVNHFLNQNSQEVLRDVKPEVSRQLNVLIQRVMNDALSQLPVSSFLVTN
ncbi:protein takeout-like [Penaeus japonicus]|uniref:protein takeout-like n=1 Tax=Penaeus japonicus TaxID=27405 RepID=UPI001C712DB6|nr:protein takeout-like [Penaeus japonicus]